MLLLNLPSNMCHICSKMFGYLSREPKFLYCCKEVRLYLPDCVLPGGTCELGTALLPHYYLNWYCKVALLSLHRTSLMAMTSIQPRPLTGWQQINHRPSTSPTALPSETEFLSMSDITRGTSMSVPLTLQRSYINSRQQPVAWRSAALETSSFLTTSLPRRRMTTWNDTRQLARA